MKHVYHTNKRSQDQMQQQWAYKTPDCTRGVDNSYPYCSVSHVVMFRELFNALLRLPPGVYLEGRASLMRSVLVRMSREREQNLRAYRSNAVQSEAENQFFVFSW